VGAVGNRHEDRLRGIVSVCDTCGSHPRPTGHARLTQHYARILIPALREVARRHGYALAVHGSLRKDIDLIAVPWRENSTSQESVADAIREATEAIVGKVGCLENDPKPMPCGRLAWAIYLGPITNETPYIDLSVMPISPERPADRTDNTTQGG
jgi:hypothetical protein